MKIYFIKYGFQYRLYSRQKIIIIVIKKTKTTKKTLH